MDSRYFSKQLSLSRVTPVFSLIRAKISDSNAQISKAIFRKIKIVAKTVYPEKLPRIGESTNPRIELTLVKFILFS